jgi:glycosyltransferase involved in cell wall biosynthesis
MSIENKEVFAVIPTFMTGDDNARANLLSNLVREASEQNYSGVLVLDDHSTGKGREILEEVVSDFTPEDNIYIHRGSKNVGPGANRNRAIFEQKLVDVNGSHLQFFDSDVILRSKEGPAIARDILADKTIGAAVGLILNQEGTPLYANYVSHFSPAFVVGGFLQEAIRQAVASGNTDRANWLHDKGSRFLENFADITADAEPEAKDVQVPVEANLLIRADDLEAVGGFPNWRFHEIQRVAYRLGQLGLRRRFDPRTVVQLTDDLPVGRKPLAQLRASVCMLGIAARHGAWYPTNAETLSDPEHPSQ